MNPVLRVSDETFIRLKAFAEPLEDTADDALRKVLDLAERHSAGATDPKRPVVVESTPVMVARGRRERTAHVLERAGILVPGTELVLLVDRLPVVIEGGPGAADPKFRAVVGDRPRARKNVVWEFDDAQYSLSTLSEQLRESYGVPLPEGGLNGYLHWGLEEDPSRSLWEIAEAARQGEGSPGDPTPTGGSKS